ncbi:glutamyl-tRNA(Gln) amidotransferase subunit E [Clostridium tepidiprofundi DSM 19306]|uniref:Glutamyl-tRNA(Gln) amidotransferase subunit E n=1 Tax=Clostridium tepidiprofundi DSM 19306 TaxID=1121338 RepID=A0A151B3N3_9CLOT|nr:GatB/YqeY domain-containing protein [Clostridium tepidiprofundi]KYH34528.1 glutamyl-tRNA(Gln) amidotransferase subunit E [Clostridium tepidiprofundi DSM 19306]
MSLKEILQQDWKDALKAKNKFKANTISMAKAAILQAEKSGTSVIDDDDIIQILSREVKQRREALEEFEKANRQDLVDKTKDEIEILLEYLPKQLSKDEIMEIIRQAAVDEGANSMKDMGRVMSAVVPKTKGRADGKLVSQLVKEYLNK